MTREPPWSPTRGSRRMRDYGGEQRPTLGSGKETDTEQKREPDLVLKRHRKTPALWDSGERETPPCSHGLPTIMGHRKQITEERLQSSFPGLRSALRRRWLRAGAGCLRPGWGRGGGHLSLCFSQACSLCSVASDFLALNKHLWS